MSAPGSPPMAQHNAAFERAMRLVSSKSYDSMLDSERKVFGAIAAQHLAAIIEEDRDQAKFSVGKQSFRATETFLEYIDEHKVPLDVNASVVEYELESHLAAIAAATNGRVYSRLMQAGLDIGWKDFIGITPLHTAAGSGAIEVIRLLMDRGCFADVPSEEDPVSPLGNAIENNQTESVLVMLEYVAKGQLDMRKPAMLDQTPLEFAQSRFFSLRGNLNQAYRTSAPGRTLLMWVEAGEYLFHSWLRQCQSEARWVLGRHLADVLIGLVCAYM